MYTFHRTSKEKLQSEAPLLVVSRNFISTLKRTNKKRNIQQTIKQQDIIFFWVPCGTALAVQVLVVWVRKGRAEGHSVHGHFSLALPNFLSIRSGAAGNIHAVCLREARWRKSLLSTSMLQAKAVRSSRSLHRQWPSCLQSRSQYTCRLTRCHSLERMRIPWTEEDTKKKNMLFLEAVYILIYIWS